MTSLILPSSIRLLRPHGPEKTVNRPVHPL